LSHTSHHGPTGSLTKENNEMDSKETTNHEPPAYRTTLDALREEVTVPLWSPDRPCYAGAVGCGRWTAYEDARTGRVPTIKVGRRVLVPTPALLRMLGAEAA